MSCLRLWLAALAAAWAVAPASAAAPAPATRAGAQRLAERIDERIAARWEKEGVRPAAPADDAAFLRRLSLDVAGRIPAVSEVRRFLADRSADKRERAIDELLDSPAYARNFTNVWLELLAPEATADFQRRAMLPSLDAWLYRQFADNVPYDRMVRDLLGLPLSNDPRQREALDRALFLRGTTDGSPVAFYVVKEGKPENLAASTARLFLGVRLECAQCHDHPFGRWTREQFWGQAAFFAGVRPLGNASFNPPTEVPDRRELPIPNTERVAQARFLDGSEPQWKFKTSARTTLADWITRRDNPFFARAAANRLWAHFFGVGLVEPVDDFNDSNPPSHPELLDELARQFADHGFDFKFLIRALARSKAYQLQSAGGGSHPRLYARMALKGLTQHQLYDCFVQATGYRDPQGADARRRFFFDGTPRAQFLVKFAAQEKRTEAQTSIPQALALMNSGLVAEVTDPEKGELLAAVANAPFMDTRARVETLFLAALSRPPRSDEAARLVAYVDKGGAAGDPKKALADVFWALLNSTEFGFNH